MKRNPKKEVHVTAQPDETNHEGVARALLQYPIQAADTIGSYLKVVNEIGVNDMTVALQKQVMAVNKGDMKDVEALLVSQAYTLDVIFHRLAQRAQNQQSDRWFELFLKLGLRAQAQCARTLETLSTIKNPPNVAFVKQANIAHNQQVNNGPQAGPPPASQPPAIEHTHGNTLDFGTPTATSRTDTAMATLAEVYRPADA